MRKIPVLAEEWLTRISGADRFFFTFARTQSETCPCPGSDPEGVVFLRAGLKASESGLADPDDLRFSLFPVPAHSGKISAGNNSAAERCVLCVVFSLPCSENQSQALQILETHTMYMVLNLKVCEGCGGLWLRIQELNEVYCAVCAEKLRAFPRRKTRSGRPRRRPHPAAAVKGGAR
jgi:hypothetical protein